MFVNVIWAAAIVLITMYGLTNLAMISRSRQAGMTTESLIAPDESTTVISGWARVRGAYLWTPGARLQVSRESLRLEVFRPVSGASKLYPTQFLARSGARVLVRNYLIFQRMVAESSGGPSLHLITYRSLGLETILREAGWLD